MLNQRKQSCDTVLMLTWEKRTNKIEVEEKSFHYLFYLYIY